MFLNRFKMSNCNSDQKVSLIARDPAIEVVNASNRQVIVELGPIRPESEFPSRLTGHAINRLLVLPA